jgi:glycine cleavage system aminomethyltransferase T
VLAFCADGGIFMDSVVFKLSSDCFWIVHPDGDMLTWLRAHKSDYNVSLSDPQSRVLQIQGPESFKIINSLSNGLIDKNFGYFHSGFFKIGGQELYVSRTGWTGELGYEIYTQGNKINCTQLWADIIKTGTPYGLKFGSMQAMNIRRIEAGILDSGSDFDIQMNPFEAGLEKFADLNKKGFLGQESLSFSPKGKLVFGVLTESVTPKSGNLILYKGKSVGRIKTGAASPFLRMGVEYVRFAYQGIGLARV